MSANLGKIMVVGGGISGISVALEAAEVGYEVVLVEKDPALGGRVNKLHEYFPKLCPPTCGLEINYRRLRPQVRIETLISAEVISVSGSAGNFTVKVRKSPTFVNERCTLCGDCAEACPSEREDSHNYGMGKTKSAYMPGRVAYPSRFVIDRESCDADCGEKCRDACNFNAIDLSMDVAEQEFSVASIVFATGWKPYDTSKLSLLGGGQLPNVITNVMMERLAAVDGPTAGKLTRPSDQKPVESVAFVQCAGSRDVNHLPYCSAICCMASLKQATYVRKKNPDAKVYIFYIDIRAAGKYEAFLSQVESDDGIEFIKGKVAGITAGEDGQVVLTAEDVLGGKKIEVPVDMAVLATGMEPTLKGMSIPGGVIKVDENGFVSPDLQAEGVFGAGVARGAGDVNASIQDATGAALRAIGVARR